MYKMINTENLHADLENRRIECATAEQYAKLNADIDTLNKQLFDSAVESVAISDNIITLLLTEPCVPQFAPVADNGESVQLKKADKLIVYSAVCAYIKKHNKAVDKGEKSGNKIKLPFTNADYVLFNIYGDNLSKCTLSALNVKSLARLAEFNADLDAFKSNSNSKLKEQLQILFTRLAEIAEIADNVKAIERNSKLIATEFIRYKGITNTLRINSADKLIDFIIQQYINARDARALTIKSSLDIHKVKTDN